MQAPLGKARVLALAVAGVLMVAVVDFLTGVELRVFPLYYFPLSLAAWHLGRSWAVAMSLLCAASWFVSNALAEPQAASGGLWVFNTAMLAASFLTVGILIAVLRTSLLHEQQLSRVDHLTQLLNSRAFYEESRRVLAVCRRAGNPVTLAYVDVDDFKRVNDLLGHAGGDEVLRTIANVIRARTRASDVAARLGGDEFALLLANAGVEQARITLDRLREGVAAACASVPAGVTVTVGAVTFLEPPADPEELVHAADNLMYAAKSTGKDRVQIEQFAGTTGAGPTP